MRLEVTSECMGVANCVGIAPLLFKLNEEGLSSTMPGEVPAVLVEKAQHAVASCPTGAIIAIDDNNDG